MKRGGGGRFHDTSYSRMTKQNGREHRESLKVQKTSDFPRDLEGAEVRDHLSPRTDSRVQTRTPRDLDGTGALVLILTFLSSSLSVALCISQDGLGYQSWF